MVFSGSPAHGSPSGARFSRARQAHSLLDEVPTAQHTDTEARPERHTGTGGPFAPRSCPRSRISVQRSVVAPTVDSRRQADDPGICTRVERGAHNRHEVSRETWDSWLSAPTGPTGRCSPRINHLELGYRAVAVGRLVADNSHRDVERATSAEGPGLKKQPSRGDDSPRDGSCGLSAAISERARSRCDGEARHLQTPTSSLLQ